MNRSEIKSTARQELKGNLGTFIGCLLIISAISIGCNTIPYVGFIGTLLLIPVLTVSLHKIILTFINKQQIGVGQLFSNMNLLGKSLGASILKSLIISIGFIITSIPFYYVTFRIMFDLFDADEIIHMKGVSDYIDKINWSDLCSSTSKIFNSITATQYIVFSIMILIGIIVSIYLSIGLSQVEFLIADNPKIFVTDSISTSFALTKGHKAELFVLNLSFILWHILSIFTLFILELVYVEPYMYVTNGHYYYYLKQDYISRCNPPDGNNNYYDINQNK